MPWSSVIGGAFDILGGGLNALYSADAAKKAYKRQVKLMKMQQNWQERMSNTAHQREVEDLREAGLNPILSATGGNGASSPVVSAPSVASASGNPFAFNNLGKTLPNAAEAKQAKTADKLAEARIKNEKDLTESQVNKNNADAALADQERRNLRYKEGNIGYLPLGHFGGLLRDEADNMRKSSDVVRAFESVLDHAAKVDLPKKSPPSKKGTAKSDEELIRNFKKEWKRQQLLYPDKPKRY